MLEYILYQRLEVDYCFLHFHCSFQLHCFHWQHPGEWSPIKCYNLIYHLIGCNVDLDDVCGVEGAGQRVPHLSQPLLQLSGLILQVGNPVVESQVLCLQTLLLLLGPVQLPRNGPPLCQLLLQGALNDGNVFLDATDVRGTKLSTST